MPIISHKEWMKLTYGGRTARRSSFLRAVDDALAAYHQSPSPPRLEALRGALNTWMASKGDDWRTSIRNRRNAVDTLQRQLSGRGGPGLSVAELAALREMRGETARVMQHLFHGSRLEWKNAFRGKMSAHLANPVSTDNALFLPVKQYAKAASTNKFGTALNTGGAVSASMTLHTMRTTGNAAGSTGQAMSKLVAQVVPSEAKAEVMSAVQMLAPSFQAEFTAAVVPVAGILVAGGAALWNTKSAFQRSLAATEAEMHRERIMVGRGGRAAIDAMIVKIDRERAADEFAAAVSYAEFGGKIAALAIDGGTASNVAIGLGANIAKLMNIIRIVYRDIKEKNAANREMQEEIGPEIFNTSPLVGCYMVACAPTSVLMEMFFERFGQAGWMDAVEYGNSKHLDPLRARARACIAEHRFEIPKLTKMIQPEKEFLPTARMEGWKPTLRRRNKGHAAMEKGRATSNMVGFGPDNLPPGLRDN